MNVDVKQYVKGSFLIWAAILMFIGGLFAALLELGEQFGQTMAFRLVTAVSTSLAILGHATTAWRDSARTRLTHGIAFAIWMVIAVAMSAFYVLWNAPQLRQAAQELIGDLFMLGQTLYTSLLGIGLAVTLTSVVIDEAVKRPLHENAQEAIAGFAAAFTIGGAIVASSVHLFEFGGMVAKQDLFARIAATAIADVGFLAIKAIISIQLDRRAKTGKYDMFDLIAWSVFGVLVAIYLMAINAAAVAAKTANLAEFVQRPEVELLVALYGMSPTILLSGFAFLTVLTKVVDYDVGRKSRAAAEDILSGRAVGEVSGMRR